jgi:hypothetical protein
MVCLRPMRHMAMKQLPGLRTSLRTAGLVALCLAATLATGCKKKKPALPAGPDPASVVCPPTDKLVHAVEQDQKGRTVRAACVVFAPGYYWLAAAVSYDAKTAADVKVHLMSGGQSQHISDVEPLPAAALSELIKKSDQVDVQIRKGNDNRLVRLGVIGRQGGGKQPEATEIGMVLQLVAHAPPKLLWIGAGDEISTSEGCRVERSVDFEMPFGSRLEMVTSARAKGGAGCTTGPASQQQIESRGVALKAGRTLAGI